ncbi:MAG: WGR domain-containing protein [Paracoccaceae bacterium]
MQQLDMFPEDICIERVDSETNMYRFYRLRLMPDLFGGVSLLRKWGRIGTQGRHMIELFAEADRAKVSRAFARIQSRQPNRRFKLLPIYLHACSRLGAAWPRACQEASKA